MKILYLGDENDARAAAQAFRAISVNARVLWAPDPAGAEAWIQIHSNVAAVVVEIQHDSQGAFFLKLVRRLGLTAPVVVVLPDGAEVPRESLEAGADDYVTKTSSLSHQLPLVVRRAIERAQISGPLADLAAAARQRGPAWVVERSAAVERQNASDQNVGQEGGRHQDLEQQLAHAKAALAEAEQRHLAALATAAERAVEREAQHEIALSKATVVREMVDEQLREGARQLAEAQQKEMAATAEVERLSQRDADLAALLAAEATTRAALERRIADGETALAAADQKRRTVDERVARAEQAFAEADAARVAAGQQVHELEAVLEQARQTLASSAAIIERLTRRETELAASLAAEAAERSTFEQRLGDAQTALKRADERATRDRLAAAQAAAERQGEFDALLGQERTSRAHIEQQLADVEADLTAVRREHAAAAAEVERLTGRETELTAMLGAEAAERTALEQRLGDARTAVRQADERAARDRRAAAQEAADRRAEFDGLIGQERTARSQVEQQRAEVEAALRDARLQHQSETASAAAFLAERQAHFDTALAEATIARKALADQAHDLEIALDEARQAVAATAATIERLMHREADLTAQLAAGTEERTTIARRLDDAETALRVAERQHRSEMASAAARLAEREARFDGELSQTAASRDQFRQRLGEVETVLAAEQRDHAVAVAEVERLTHRETELTTLLGAEAVERAALQQRLSDARTALTDADERSTGERLAAAQAAAERQATFDDLIGQERSGRARVEQQLADAESSLREAEQQHRSAMASAATRLALREAQFQRELAQTVASRDEFRQRLGDVETVLAGARRDYAAAAAEIERLTQSEATLVASLRERDAQIEAHTARHAAALEAAAREHAKLRDVETTLAARGLQVAHLNETVQAVTDELVSARTRSDVLQAEAERVPQLLKQLEDLQTEIRVRFERSPHALCRSTRLGTITDANRTFAALLGCRRPDELQGVDFAAAIFESPDDLSWLLERSRRSQATVSTETTWRRKNGDRFPVRVSAFASAAGFIEIAADDLSSTRALEERLSQAQHMESVGRLASEVAITCSKLLSHVQRDAREWVTTVAGTASDRHRGEILLDDVTRATGHLQRLVDYSEEQDSALAPVDLHKVLRNLKPVLKHVAGDDVIVELPKRSSPLNVDLSAERVERLLVNLASYGRERMPFGGRLKIELGTVVVDRKFASQYPNVRQGLHALITVTEERRPMDAEQTPLRHRAGAADSGERAAAPGVDLAVVQELIRECGGHLWMTVERSGNMTVKMRLPLRAWHREAHRTDTRVSAVPVPWAALSLFSI